jgi:hypothetical protein
MDIDSAIDDMCRSILIGDAWGTTEDELKMVALIRSHGDLLANRLEALVREDWAADERLKRAEQFFSLSQQNPQPDAGSKRP